jgi:3',5'-cyclic AMP phosphodiesterase CpdA
VLVAHFSDVHALSLAGASPLAFLSKRFAGGVNLLTRRRNRHPVRLFESLIRELNRVKPDAIIITGDLTNLSLAGEFTLAREILGGLAIDPAAIAIVPGNHDAYVWTAFLARAFERAFGHLLGDRATWPLVRVIGDLAVVGISTALPSPVPLADGWVGARQLRAVEQALMLHGSKFRVVALHHPPVENRHAFLRGLRDRVALQHTLGRAGAELVLHGHEHRDVRATVRGPDGDIPVIGVGSATYDDPRDDRRARFNLYRVEGGALTGIETRVHDDASDRWTVR